MLISMCKESLYVKVKKLELKCVGVQDRALKLCNEKILGSGMARR